MNKTTLLDALCAANGQQGGTIHQFMGRQDYSDMQRTFDHLHVCGLVCQSKAALNKLAKQYHVTINWN